VSAYFTINLLLVQGR